MVTDKRSIAIENNIGLVHSIAKRFKGRGVEYDDLFQCGCVGLIKAVDNFDETLGYKFSTYAVPVIMGEIKRLFRDGGAVKVSRALKEKSLKAQAVREQFINRELREPTVSEFAELLGCDISETAEILNVINPVISINQFGEDGSEDFDIPVDDSEKLFDRLSVNQVLETLNEQERKIVDFRFYKGKTQSETASFLGISQVQVSRKEKALLLKLREQLS